MDRQNHRRNRRSSGRYLCRKQDCEEDQGKRLEEGSDHRRLCNRRSSSRGGRGTKSCESGEEGSQGRKEDVAE